MNDLDNLILHPRTKLILDRVLKSQPHALILEGGNGSGKTFLAWQITKFLQQDDKNAQFNQMILKADEKGTISIDLIRELYQKTQNHHTRKQVITILDAEAMGESAQNAFLKLLEEPPAQVHFIITIKSIKNLLPTIASRAQILPVLPVNTQQINQLSKRYPNHTQQELSQALLKSAGRMGAFDNLFNQPSDDLTDEAKTMFVNDKQTRIINAQPIVADKIKSIKLLQAMLNVANAAAQASASKNLHTQTSSWFKRINLITSALKNLENYGNAKIQLLNVLYNL